MRLPAPRGPLSDFVLRHLSGDEPEAAPVVRGKREEALAGDDFHLALYVLYELHYRGFEGVDDRWEWHPGLLAVRSQLELAFERELLGAVEAAGPDHPDRIDRELRDIVDGDDGPSLSRHLERRGTREEFRDFVIHRSAYQLKEADPHSWAIPRLVGAPKAALLEIQFDEYGEGVASRMHAELFRETMTALELDGTYGAYLDHLPGVTLATVNLMSLFGLHRRWRGAIVGHLAAFEMSSSLPNRRYGNGLRRLGFSTDATGFYDEHVEADAVHENVAAVDLAGGLARQEEGLIGDILFGARALVELDARFALHLLDSWTEERSSLLAPLATTTTSA